jgi:hypothetical protein
MLVLRCLVSFLIILGVTSFNYSSVSLFIADGNVDGEYVLPSDSTSPTKDSFNPGIVRVNTRLFNTIFRFDSDPWFIYSVASNGSLEMSVRNMSLPSARSLRNIVTFTFIPKLNSLKVEVTYNDLVEKGSVVLYRNPHQLLQRHCQTGNIFYGEWLYDKRNLNVMSYPSELASLCPHLTDSVVADWIQKAGHFPHRPKNHITQAFFYPYDNCYTFPFAKSLSLYQSLRQKRFPHIVVVGDSLSKQLEVGLRCDYEFVFRVPPDPTTEVASVWHPYLRQDFPCSHLCNGTSHPNTAIVRGEFKNNSAFCNNCAHYKKNISPTDWTMNKHLFSFIYRLPTDMDILVLNCGAWYSWWKGMDNSTQEFREMLLLMRPHLQSLKDRHPDVSIFWFSLPSVVHHHNPGYEHHLFSEKNKVARSILSTVVGLTFIDSEELSLGRHLRENITADGMHWVNPGSFAIPSFAIEKMMHLYVTERLSNNK